ncbi:PPK2 family polyphosphate kinase [Myroides indicus]|uniref:PPK2 family polyphosphate:nucleotide phosphotransferase n=1 Tax=Myroides indicus TaxID=1323422 RepID=A0A4R7EZI7_9FLAO|nr:PPK2 family polyphosphate kinase [Myroides indicus]TDS55299.1 PPK2 family polyphosphate:nucleotide phosphotransferase [Myroides indicus]
MKIEEKYKITSKIELKDLPTVSDLAISGEKAARKLDSLSRKLGKFQDVMYAHNRYSVLICLQGMDTAGKDSLIREVFKLFNARGVVVQSFKKPTSNELEHDYLWRHYINLPEKGKFTVFNRTHYENVLVSRVHPKIVMNERLPHVLNEDEITDEFWQKRYDEINNFEQHLANNGVIVIKFFLHLSKGEQKRRILRRLNKEKHNWKFAPEDVKEREYWEEYQKYYEEAVNQTSKSNAPWYVIPADDKAICRYIFAKILREVFKKYTDIRLPELRDEIKEDLELYKKRLLEE